MRYITCKKCRKSKPIDHFDISEAGYRKLICSHCLGKKPNKQQKLGRIRCLNCGRYFKQQHKQQEYCSDFCKKGLHYCQKCEQYKDRNEFWLSKDKTRLKSQCKECIRESQRKVSKKETDEHIRQMERSKPGPEYKRKCATCGKPTNNYRCSKCWSEKKETSDMSTPAVLECEL